jgi:adenylate kinase
MPFAVNEPAARAGLAALSDDDRVEATVATAERARKRLRGRGEPAASVMENRQAEALGIVLTEAIERHGAGATYEVETTERDPAAGTVDYTGHLEL